MDPQSNKNDLLAAWSSLKSFSGADGWRTIPISHQGLIKVLAGRCYPSNAESILIEFKNIKKTDNRPLPEGKGFIVCEVNFESTNNSESQWYAINKKPGSNIDFFLMMSSDLLDLFKLYEHLDSFNLYKLFISRIKSWQDFMNREYSGKLSYEYEIGLFGELELFSRLSKFEISVDEILNSWKGPESSLHDYVSSRGAIEVKSTVSNSGFNVTIGSLEQLDSSLVPRLFLIGFRFIEGEGETLIEKIESVKKLFGNNSQSLELFNNLILEMGYLPEFASKYTNRFLFNSLKVFEVNNEFPSLTRRAVKRPIVNANYKLNLDLIDTLEVEFKSLKNIYEVILSGTN